MTISAAIAHINETFPGAYWSQGSIWFKIANGKLARIGADYQAIVNPLQLEAFLKALA